MAPDEVDFFVARSSQRYFAAGEVVQEPAAGPVGAIFFIRQGEVTGSGGGAEAAAAAIHYETGDLFPLAAALGGRAVTATYTSAADTFVLALPTGAMQELARRSAAFAEFLHSRIERFLELSQRAMRDAYASKALAEQSLETPLGQLVSREPVTCRPDTSLRDALAEMHRRRIGSILACGPSGRVEGILTRHDVLGKVALAGRSLEDPVSSVMAWPVHTLTAHDTAEQAALLMAREGVRHVPVTRGDRLIGLVSERDLFALQRLSLKHVSTGIRLAEDGPALRACAADLRRLARNLLSQGVQARQLTALVSHMNDLLTRRALALTAAAHGLSLERACWLALGSEGRGEQTVATDQDNALVLPPGTGDAERRQWLQFGDDVNRLLDACGYPLCRGGVMAGRPDCCLTLDEWQRRFGHWIEHGAPRDLLRASIFFDLRGVAGDLGLADALVAQVQACAGGTPRFLKQMALNALAHEPPLNWLGGIETDAAGGIDLKLQGTALFVDATRVYALARRAAASGTRERIETVAPALGVPPAESGAWVAGFEFLQLLRLRVQLGETGDAGGPNRLRVDRLHDVDRRVLKESLRMARRMQQRLRLDYER
jgi:CBS domain-containing protein